MELDWSSLSYSYTDVLNTRNQLSVDRHSSASCKYDYLLLSYFLNDFKHSLLKVGFPSYESSDLSLTNRIKHRCVEFIKYLYKGDKSKCEELILKACELSTGHSYQSIIQYFYGVYLLQIDSVKQYIGHYSDLVSKKSNISLKDIVFDDLKNILIDYEDIENVNSKLRDHSMSECLSLRLDLLNSLKSGDKRFIENLIQSGIIKNLRPLQSQLLTFDILLGLQHIFDVEQSKNLLDLWKIHWEEEFLDLSPIQMRLEYSQFLKRLDEGQSNINSISKRIRAKGLESYLMPYQSVFTLRPFSSISKTLELRLNPFLDNYFTITKDSLSYTGKEKKICADLSSSPVSLKLIKIISGPKDKKISNRYIFESLYGESYFPSLHSDKLYKVLKRFEQKLESCNFPIPWERPGDGTIKTNYLIKNINSEAI